MVAALIRPHPLSSLDQRYLALPEGATLDDMARLVWPDQAVHDYVVAFVGDVRVRARDWKRVRPKEGALVRMGLTCMHGGGDSKSIIALVAMVVITIFAPYAAGVILGPGASAFAVSAVAAGITIAGSLAISALFKPPQLNVGGPSTNPQDAQTYSITGQQNAATPYGPMLRVYGQHRIFPRIAAAPYTTTEGPNQFLYMLLDCGYGPLDIDHVQIGDTPILDYRDVQVKLHERWRAGDALTLYRNETSVESVGVTLKAGIPAERTGADRSTALTFDFVFPQGLVEFNDRGEKLVRQVAFDLQLRPAGSAGAWQAARSFVYSVSRGFGTNVNLAPFIMYANTVGGGRGGSVFPQNMNDVQVANSADVQIGDSAYFLGASYTVTNVYQGPLTGPHMGKRMVFAPALPKNYFGAQAYVYISRPVAGVSVGDATTQPLLFSITVEVPRGRWETRVTRTSADSVSDRVRDVLAWTALRSITDRPPIAVHVDHTLIELKIRASEQLSGVVQNLNCIATSILPVWDGASWVEQPTRNPAWAYADVLRGSASTRPLPDARLDVERLKAWADYCDQEVPNGVDGEPEPRVRFDHVVDYATTTYQLLQSIASVGRASPAVRDGRHGVIIDEAQTVPVQLFTPRNSWGFNARRAYISEPDAMRVTFIDPASQWQDGNVVVYAGGKNAENSLTFEDMKLFGVTRYTQATRDARYLKAQALLRREEFSIQVDIENLIAERGDLVIVQHDVLQVGGESTRIKTVAGDTITLVDPFGAIPALRYGVRIRLSDGTITLPIEVTPQQPDQLVLSSVPDPVPEPGDLVAWGYLEVETGEYLMKQIAPGDDLTATLTLVEIARAVYDADTGDIPAYVPPSGARPTAGAGPAVERLRVIQRDRTVAREPYADLVLAWDAPAIGPYPRYRVYSVEESGVQMQLAVTPNVTVLIETNVRLLDEQLPRTLAVVGIDAIGRESEPAFLTFTPSDPMLVPGDAQYLSSNVHDKTTTLTWLAPNDPAEPGNDQVLYFEVRWVDSDAPTWGTASKITELVPWNVTTVTVPSRNGAYLVKAITSSKIESTNAAMTVIAVEDIVIQDIWSVHRFDPAWAGVHDGTEVDSLGRLVLATLPDGTYPPVGVFYATEREIFFELLQLRVSATSSSGALNNRLLMADWVPLAMAVPLAGARQGVDWNASIWIAADQADPYVMADWIPLAAAAPLDPIPPVFGGSWRPFLHGEVLARQVRFAVVLESFQPNISPRVTTAGVDIDFPERSEEHGDILVPAAGLGFVFTRPFVFPPSVAIDLQSAAPGDYVDRGAVSSTGVPLFVRDAFGAAKAGVVDVSAFGVGRVMP